MSEETEDSTPIPAEVAGQGVLVRAANGDVIRYDSTGLVMRLSDKVIADIADRLDGAKIGASTAEMRVGRQRQAPLEEALEDFDVWDVHEEGDWLQFSARLPGKQGVRAFRRHVEGGAIVGHAPGPLYGILGIGGARAAHAFDGPADFPQHVLAPADDIGAVGHAGIDRATDTDRLEHLRELTHEALIADTFLNWQMDKFGPLPLFVTRVETDVSATAAELATGTACDNLLIAARNLKKAAGLLNKTPKILAVNLSFALEDVSGSATEYRDGMLALMRRIENGLNEFGMDQPVFLLRFESGTGETTDAPAIEGQWELAWNSGDHKLVFSAPSYMFAHDAYDRPTEDALREMAEMSAAALADPERWRCPVFHLAERSQQKGGTIIRVVAQSIDDLVIDITDPMDAGVTAGFALVDAMNDARIISVDVDPEDSKTLLLELDKEPIGDALKLSYAYAATPRSGPYAANTGAIRDAWVLESATGRRLHRWALPCLRPVQIGGGTDA